MIRNLCTNKVMDYLRDEINFNINKESNIRKYFITSQEYLIEKFRIGLSIPFKSNKKIRIHFFSKKPRCPAIYFLVFYRN